MTPATINPTPTIAEARNIEATPATIKIKPKMPMMARKFSVVLSTASWGAFVLGLALGFGLGLGILLTEERETRLSNNFWVLSLKGKPLKTGTPNTTYVSNQIYRGTHCTLRYELRHLQMLPCLLTRSPPPERQSLALFGLHCEE
jgi:hypothetical protein